MHLKKIGARIRDNWKAGLTVSLVSLPLSISLGIAGGATPLMGVITAVWAGLVAALFGGSNYNIVGPTGALSGLLAAFALQHGTSMLPALAALSGVLILLAYMLRWERYIVFIPASVVHGFTLGVACIIGLNQLNFALGLSRLKSHPEFIANVTESLKNIGASDPATFGIFLIGLVALLIAAKKFPQYPNAIFLALVGLALGWGSSTGYVPIELQTLYSRFGEIPADITAISDLTSIFTVWRVALVPAATVALVAILETLISAKIADGMTRTKFNQRKEMLGLGLANIASGLFGGIPATAALARTSLNVQSGANHSSSAVVSSIAVAAIALVFLPVFKFLPLAIVASILVYVAVRMVEHEHFLHLYRHDKTAFGISIVVAIITIIEDPIIGIIAGAAISLLIAVNKLSAAQCEVSINRDRKFLGKFNAQELKEIEDHGDVLVYRFAGELTYMNCQGHVELISGISPKTEAVVLSFRNLFYVDIDGLDVVSEIIEMLEDQDKKIALSGVNSVVRPLLEKMPWFKKYADSHLIFPNSQAAVEYLQK